MPGSFNFAPDNLTPVSPVVSGSRLMDVAWAAEADTILVLVYVERGDAVRAISLRRASRQERRLYEGRQKNRLEAGAC
jgi:uncharacterized DUF497 family protein